MPTIHYGTVRPYQRLGGRANAIPRPVLDVRSVAGRTTTPSILTLVDSGADVSTFHLDVATLAGIELGRCRQEQARSLGGVADTYVCPVRLEVEGRRFEADVHFTTAFRQRSRCSGAATCFASSCSASTSALWPC